MRYGFGILGMIMLNLTSVFAQSVGESDPLRARLVPSLVHLKVGGTQQFRVVIEPHRLRAARTAKEVKWYVNGIRGGDKAVGRIDETGFYRAPTRQPECPEIHIHAEVPEAENHIVFSTVLIGCESPKYTRSKMIRTDTASVHFAKPFGFALDNDGTFILSDAKQNKVFRFTSEGEPLHEIGAGLGNAPGKFMDVRDVAISSQGHVYVSDERTGPPRIQVFDKDGKYLFSFAEKGIGQGQIFRTGGMAFSPDERLYVVDIDTMRVSIFSTDGKFLDLWHREGARAGGLNAPYGVAVDPSGDVFVMGYYGPCQKFSAEGVFQFAFAQPEPPEGPVGFQSITVDRWGNVYLAARLEGESPGDFDPKIGKKVVILKFNNQGDFITQIPLAAGELGETRMAVDENDRLYVVFCRTAAAGIEVYAMGKGLNR